MEIAKTAGIPSCGLGGRWTRRMQCVCFMGWQKWSHCEKGQLEKELVFSELDSVEMTRARVDPYPKDHYWNCVAAVASAFWGVSGTGMCREQEEPPKERRAVCWVLSRGCLSRAGSALGSSQPARQTPGLEGARSPRDGARPGQLLLGLPTEGRELFLTRLQVSYRGLLYTVLIFQHLSRVLCLENADFCIAISYQAFMVFLPILTEFGNKNLCVFSKWDCNSSGSAHWSFHLDVYLKECGKETDCVCS